MKRVRIAKGKHVVISNQLAEKAARVFASGLTREQVLEVAANEPRHATGLMAGSKKPPGSFKAEACCARSDVE